MRRLAVLLLLFPSLAAAQQPGALPYPEELYRQAHDRMAVITPPLNKGYALGLLLQRSAGRRIDESAAWSEEAFQVSQQMPEGSRRLFVQQMAIAAMSRVDADRALDMLSREDPASPDLLTSFNIGQGIATAGVFSSLLAKHGADIKPKLLEIANEMGAKGVYPYLAVEQLMYRGTAEDFAEVFKSTVSAYVHSKPAVTNEFEFVSFLKRAAPRLPVAIAKPASSQIAARIEKFAASDAPCNSNLRLYTDKGMVVLNCAERIIYEALPSLEEMDSGVAAKLRANHSVFRQLDGAKVQSFMPMANAPVTKKAAESQAEFDASMMLTDVAKTDPDKAADLADTLGNDFNRLNTTVLVAKQMVRTEPEKARAKLYQVLNEASEVDSSGGKLGTLISNVVEVAARLGDQTLFETSLRAAFAMAHDFAAANKNVRPELRSLYASNCYKAWSVTRLGAVFAPQLTLDLIPTLGDDEGEAYLLMTFAEALQRPPVLR